MASTTATATAKAASVLTSDLRIGRGYCERRRIEVFGSSFFRGRCLRAVRSVTVRSGNGSGEEKGLEEENMKKDKKGGLFALKSIIVKGFGAEDKIRYKGEYRKAVEKAESFFFSVSYFVILNSTTL